MFYVSWLHQHGNQSLFLTKPEVSLTHDMCLLDNKGFLMYVALFFLPIIFLSVLKQSMAPFSVLSWNSIRDTQPCVGLQFSKALTHSQSTAL